MNRDTLLACVALTGIAFVGVLVIGGPLNPPSGPISSGGQTTQEIFDAVTGLSNAIGGSNRGPAIPGADYTGGTIACTNTSIGSYPPVSGPILGARSSAGYVFDPLTRTTSARANPGNIIVVREMGPGSADFFRASVSAGSYGQVVLTIPTAGGTIEHKIVNVSISGLRYFNMQRADGSYAALEEIEFSGQTSDSIKEPSGSSFGFNWMTGKAE